MHNEFVKMHLTKVQAVSLLKF